MYDRLNANLSSGSGIYSGADIVKLILAGADSLQVVSAIYKNNVPHIDKMIEELKSWMQAHKYDKLKDFRGKLSKKNVDDHRIYKRSQYVDILMQADAIFKKYPMP